MSSSDNPKHVVLVVDDEPLIRMNAVDMLFDAGFDVVEAADAAEALNAIADHPDVGLLFTDVNMPGQMDGLELAYRVHQLHPQIRLILTSGKVWLDPEELPDHGQFLGKPYHEQQFLGLVHAAFTH